MTHINDIDAFIFIDDILSRNNKDLIQVMSNVLDKYNINTDLLLKKTSNYLCEITDFFWEPVIKEENYSTSHTEYPAYPSNHLAWTWTPETVTETGKKTSKTIRCANHDIFFTITEKTENYIPKNISSTNTNSYESFSYQDLFNINIKSDNDIIDKKIVKEALIHTYKELLFNNANDILNDYYEELKKYKEDLLERIEREEEKKIENERILLIVNDQIDIYKRALANLKSFDIDKFDEHNKKFLTTSEYRRKSELATREDVLNEILDYNIYQEDLQELLEKKILQFDKSKNDNLGWNITFDCFIPTDDLSYSEGFTKFISAPSEIISLIEHVDNFLTKLSFKYDADPDYPEVFFNRKSYDKNLSYGAFRSYSKGELEYYIDNKKIKENELFEQLSSMGRLIQIVLRYDISELINNKEIQNEMKQQFINDNSYKEIDYLDDDLRESDNWTVCSDTYDKDVIKAYCKQVQKIIRQVKNIIQKAHENSEKAEYFKDYTNFYNMLFTQYAAINQYKKLLDNCSSKKEKIMEDTKSINDNITSLINQCNEIDTTREDIKKYTKKRD